MVTKNAGLDKSTVTEYTTGNYENEVMMIWYDVWYMMFDITYDIIYDIMYDVIWWYDMIHDMIFSAMESLNKKLATARQVHIKTMMIMIMMILFIFVILIVVNNRTKIMTLLKLFRKRSISCRWLLISIVSFLHIYKWFRRLLSWYQYDYAHFSPGDDDDYDHDDHDNVDDNNDHRMVVEVVMIMIIFKFS